MENFHKQTLNTELREHIMNRINWFTHLRIIFNNACKDNVQTKEQAAKSDLINELLEKQTVLFLTYNLNRISL